MKDKIFIITLGKEDCERIAAPLYQDTIDVLYDGNWEQFDKRQLDFQESLTCSNSFCGRR